MLDIKFIRENPEIVKQNIRNKFQDKKLPLVDEVIALDEELRAAIKEANDLRASRNALSKQIGMLMGQAKKDPSKAEEAEAVSEPQETIEPDEEDVEPAPELEDKKEPVAAVDPTPEEDTLVLNNNAQSVRRPSRKTSAKVPKSESAGDKNDKNDKGGNDLGIVQPEFGF